jgi:hypothetical protein
MTYQLGNVYLATKCLWRVHHTRSKNIGKSMIKLEKCEVHLDLSGGFASQNISREAVMIARTKV